MWGQAIRLLAGLLLGGALLRPAAPAFSCPCSGRGVGPPGEAFGYTDAVFAGSVEGVREPGRLPASLQRLARALRLPLAPPPAGRLVTFAVSAAWKGVTTREVIVLTGYGSGDCGYDFILGRPYLVYAHVVEGQLKTNLCTRTAALPVATEDLSYLNTLPQLRLEPAPTAAGLGLLAPLACLSAVGLLGAALWRRRPGRPAGPRPHPSP